LQDKNRAIVNGALLVHSDLLCRRIGKELSG
jgi:hypothetical protein